MDLFLVDQNVELVECWKREFAAFPEVTIMRENILAVARNAIVSPANSYGYMDGGIDRFYVEHFGDQLQVTVMDAISRCPEGFLPVGASLIVRTGDKKIPYLIVSPTMLLPEPVRAVNCFHAMSAILRIARQYADIIDKIFCPGLGTGVGQVPYSKAAKEMALAYEKWKQAVD